jgi:hypothetical protein
MLTTKIRTTLTVVAAAFAVAVATGSVVPAAHALDNNTPASEETCENAWDQFAVYVRLAVDADREGRTADRDYYLSQARELKDAARRSGCDWAQFRPGIVDRFGGRPGGVDSPTVKPGDSPATGVTAISPRDSAAVGKVPGRTGGSN